MQCEIDIKLNNVDPRRLRITEHFADRNKINLIHSNNLGQISTEYDYSIDKENALKLARAIIDYFEHDKEVNEG